MNGSAALYLRLSREDGLNISSESITNQKEFLLHYAAEQKLSVGFIYEDDGVSGTTFDRPGFKKMIAAIEAGKIKTVLTKDLSRLGRDYILTGHYLEVYFPQKQVRYIAVNDGIDTFSANGSNDMSPFKAVFNDFYAKDISKKVRSSLDSKKQSGKFIGSTAPYGYQKDPLDKNHLLINPETALVVRRIFDLFLAGNSLHGIASILSENKIITPSALKKNRSNKSRFPGIWNEMMIKRILSSQTYIGNLVQNRSKKISYKVDKRIHLPKEDWVISPNTHEPIIPNPLYEMAAAILEKRAYHAKNRTGSPHLLSGIAFCADCGAPLSPVKESPTRSYLVCSSWKRHAPLKLCTSHSIRESFVEEAVKKELRDLCEQLQIKSYLLQNILTISTMKFQKESQKNSATQNLEQLQRALLSLYKDKASGLLTEEEYSEFSLSLKKEKSALELALKKKQQKPDPPLPLPTVETLLDEFLSFETVSHETLSVLLEAVRIEEGKKIELDFSFADPFS